MRTFRTSHYRNALAHAAKVANRDGTPMVVYRIADNGRCREYRVAPEGSKSPFTSTASRLVVVIDPAANPAGWRCVYA